MAEGGVENIVKQGYLRRINTPNNRFSGLFKRSEGNKWFVLVVRQDCPYLQQYDADVDVFSRSPLHTFSLAQCKAVRSMGSSDPPTFCVVCADRVIELVAASRTQMLDWVSTVESCLTDLGIIKKEPVDHVYTVCPAVVRKPRVSKEVLEEREAEALRQTEEAQVPTTHAPSVPTSSDSNNQQTTSSNSNTMPVENRLTSASVEGATAMDPRPRIPVRSKTLAEAKALPSSVAGLVNSNAMDTGDAPPPLPSRPTSYAAFSMRHMHKNSSNSLLHPVTDSSNDSDFVSPEVIAQLRMVTENSQPPSSSHTNASYSSSLLLSSNGVTNTGEHEASRSRSPSKSENGLNSDQSFLHKSPDVRGELSGLSSSSSSTSLSSLGPSDLGQLREFPRNNRASTALENDYSLLPSETGAESTAPLENDYSLLPSSNRACASDKSVEDGSERTPLSPSAFSRGSTKPKPRPRHVLMKQESLLGEVQSLDEFSTSNILELNSDYNSTQECNASVGPITTCESTKEINDFDKHKDVNENCYGLIFDPSIANIPTTAPISASSPIPPLPPRHDSLPEAPHMQTDSHETLKHNVDSAPPLPRRNGAGSVRGTVRSMSTPKSNASQDLEIPPMPPRRRSPVLNKMASLDDHIQNKYAEDSPPALPSRPSQSFYIKRPQLLSHSNSESSAPQATAAAAILDAPRPENPSNPSGLSRMMLLDRAHSLHTVVSLKQTQAEILQSEIATSSLTLTLTQKSGHGLALVDWNSLPCVVGWNQRDFPSLHGKLHLGDQLISVNGVRVSSVDVAQKLLKGATTPKITVALHRMPYAKVFAIRRDAEGQSLGIKREGGSGEIVYVDPNGLAAQHGLTAYAPGVATELRCNWFITEINNRPVSLFFKENEIEHRLAAVGREISIVVQPSDFIQEIRRQFKKIRNYKSYIAQ